GRGNPLAPADRRAVAGRGREHRGDLLAREPVGGDLFRGQLAQRRLLLPGGRGVDALVGGIPVAGGQAAVDLGRRLPGDRGDLRGEQGENDPVLVGGP